MEEEKTTQEIARLIKWLVAHGHTYEEACDCIKTIA